MFKKLDKANANIHWVLDKWFDKTAYITGWIVLGYMGLLFVYGLFASIALLLK